MAKNEVKWGAILSYVLIVLNSIYGLVMMPFILGAIGESEFGVYKTIGAMTSTISVMELGLGSTMQKYIAQFRAQKDEKMAYNYSAMCLIQAVIRKLQFIVEKIIGSIGGGYLIPNILLNNRVHELRFCSYGISLLMS